MVCTRQEDDHAIIPCPIISHISTVADTVLPDVLFLHYPSYAMLFDTVFHLHPLHHSSDFLFHILRQIHPMVQHNTVLTRPAVCVRSLFILDHSMRLRSTMEIVKDRSHIKQTQTISTVYFFLINSTEQDMHRPSIFRVYVFLRDISSRIIYSSIYYVKLYPK